MYLKNLIRDQLGEPLLGVTSFSETSQLITLEDISNFWFGIDFQ